MGVISEGSKNSKNALVKNAHPNAGISVKVVVISLVFIAFANYINVRSGNWYGLFTWTSPQGSINVGSYVLIIFLVVLSSLLRPLMKRALFSRAELVAIFALTVTGSLIGGYGWMFFQFFSGPTLLKLNLQHAGIFEGYVNSLSAWLVPKSEDAFWGMWMGDADVPWGEWIMPIIMWTVFAFALYWIMMTLAFVFRRQWLDNEKLSFPLTRPTLVIIGSERTEFTMSGVWSFSMPGVWKNGVFWLGVILLNAPGVWNWLSSYLPILPTIQLRWEPRITTSPWVGLTYPSSLMVHVFDWPWIIGLAYFIPTQLSFSIWFFYLVINRGSAVLQAILGGGPHTPTIWGTTSIVLMHYFSLGSSLAMGALLFWWNRKTIKEMVVSAFANKDSSSDPLVRTHILGFFVALLIVAVFLCVFLKATILFTLFYILVFCFGVTSTARVRVQAGMPEDHFTTGRTHLPWILENALGRSYMSINNYMALGWLNQLDFSSFGLYTSYALEYFKLSEEVGLSTKSLVKGLYITLIFAMVSAFVLGLPGVYKYGLNFTSSWLTGMGSQGFDPVRRLFYETPETAPGNLLAGTFFVGLSAGITGLLGHLTAMYVWWPFHPLGFLVAVAQLTSRQYWFSVFLAWFLKVLIVRYGGNWLQERLAPFFMGTAVGYILFGSIRLVVDSIAVFL
jgi:hypothetical protein